MERRIIDIDELSAVQGGTFEALNFGEGNFKFTYGKGGSSSSGNKFYDDCQYLVNYERTYPGILDAFKAQVSSDAQKHHGSAEDIDYGQRLASAAEAELNLIRLQEQHSF
ncbi:MAG: hypothetical protein WCP79_05615 [Bacillota bacterium]